MDSLPVELVRLVFQYCDPASVRVLRLASRRYADVGYEYLLEPHFNAVEWRDDVSRLCNIANHDRLRGGIRSLTFNFAKLDEDYARQTTFFQHWLREAEQPSTLLQYAWTRYYELEGEARKLPPFHSRSAAIEDAFKRLPNLRHVEITHTKCPYDIPLLQDVFQVRTCRKRDRGQACKNINAVVSAFRHARPASLSIDLLPLEIFRLADDRRLWLDCARSFASLSRLDLVLDTPANLLPASRSRAVNGLGGVLHSSVNLTHLSLAFQHYHAPAQKFHLSFQALFCGSDFVFPRLTDLKLEGVSCAEDDLRGFLLRHGATLERLRLGGRGLAKPFEWSMGGVHLHQGSFRGLFTGLRGRMPRLRRFHMEGDAEAGDFTASSREVYMFRPVTDDDWAPLGGGSGGDAAAAAAGYRGKRVETLGACVKVVDSLALERYLVEGGRYPRLGKEEVGDGL
ncbi:uncharacterized protein P884DRAFT_299478 [Thermothelomyces heterothallicus CBS 202.75]|uniref:uncharacterized protein n=1 Tax=Thermothelomyces heterothallicus CBS 202.75 TaxID=1149848 RepID=UPI0037439204